MTDSEYKQRNQCSAD